MTNDIGERVEVPQGDAKIIPFVLTDKDDNPLNVDSLDISWRLQDTRTRENVLSLNDDKVEIIDRNSENGQIEIKIETGATSNIDDSDYREVLQIVDSNGDQTTWVGTDTFLISEDG